LSHLGESSVARRSSAKGRQSMKGGAAKKPRKEKKGGDSRVKKHCGVADKGKTPDKGVRGTADVKVTMQLKEKEV